MMEFSGTVGVGQDRARWQQHRDDQYKLLFATEIVQPLNSRVVTCILRQKNLCTNLYKERHVDRVNFDTDFV